MNTEFSIYVIMMLPAYIKHNRIFCETEGTIRMQFSRLNLIG